MNELRIGMLCSRIRAEERLLIEAAKRRRVELALIDSRQLVFDLSDRTEFDVVLQREPLHARALYALNLFESSGVRAVNGYRVALTCGDRVATMKAFHDAGIPTPDVRVAFTRECALSAIEEMGYPVLLKPITGRGGQLMAKINDRDAALAILEHKEHLGSYYHKVFFVQKHPQMLVRDLRSIVIGDEVVYSAYSSEVSSLDAHTPGSFNDACTVTADIQQISLAAAQAVSGGVVSVYLMETSDGLVAHAVNDTIEFRASGTDVARRISEKIIEYALEGSCDGLK